MLAPRIAGLLGAAIALSAIAVAGHCDSCGCEPDFADPATINGIGLPDGTVLYVEERAVPAPANSNPPIPGSGFLIGEGTWVYQESNGLYNLQRGGAPALFCTNPLGEPDPFCTIGDPINDENCGRGPDTLLF